MPPQFRLAAGFAAALVAAPLHAQSQQSMAGAQDLAKQLANPVASLINVLLQNNFDFGGGFKDDAFRYTLYVQPVVPIGLNTDWNLISRMILPIVYQKNVLAPDIPPGDVDSNDDQCRRVTGKPTKMSGPYPSVCR